MMSQALLYILYPIAPYNRVGYTLLTCSISLSLAPDIGFGDKDATLLRSGTAASNESFSKLLERLHQYHHKVSIL